MHIKYTKITHIHKAISVAILATLLFSFLAYDIHHGYHQNIRTNEKNVIEKDIDQYDTVISIYRMLSKTYYDEIINKDEIKRIFSEALLADDKTKAILRDKLYLKLESTYLNAHENHFRQLHFVLPNNTSFLRLHKPESFGDDLTGIRKTIEIVNKENTYIEGFEEGRIFNGYRFQYPLFYSGNYIGTVEISISMLAVIQSMDELFNIPGVFMVAKSISEQKVWDELLDVNYEITNLSSEYYLDKATTDYTYSNIEDKNLFDSFSSNDEIKSKIKNGLLTKKHFLIDNRINGVDYTAVFHSINNVSDNHAAYLLFIHENPLLKTYKRNYYVKILMIFALWLIVIISIIMFYISRRSIEKISFHDKLTGLKNRRALFTDLEILLQKNSQSNNQNFGIFMFDIDFFKKINDTYGHNIGDEVLIAVSKELSELLSVCEVYRYGGDEFIIIHPHLKNETLNDIANSIIEHINKTSFLENPTINITLSMGTAKYILNETIDDLIKRADTNLYLAKKQGRNRVVFDK